MLNYDVPRYLYHVAQGAQVFNTAEDVEEALKNGWQMTPNQMNHADEIKNKILFHKAQVKELMAELADIESGEKVTDDAESDHICAKCGREFPSDAGVKAHEKKCKGKASDQE
jgi:hypothetical protein